jgi:hypothetical protein
MLNKPNTKTKLLEYLNRWKWVDQVVQEELRRSTIETKYFMVKYLWVLNKKLGQPRKKPKIKKSFVNPQWTKLRQLYSNDQNTP